MILFEKIDEMVLGKEIDEELTWFNKKSSGKKRKLGLIDPFQLVEKLTKNDLKDILKDLNTDEIPNTKRDLILTLYKTIHIFFDASKEIQAKYGNPIDYLGNILYDNPITRPYFQRFDVISLRELIEIFAEFSAELGFNVYDLSIGKIFPGDLFLTRKVPTPMNQIVLLVGAYDIVDKYDEIIAKIVLASNFCDWSIFVTTPQAVLKKKWFKLREDMKNLGAWIYMVDPFHGVIYGISKGRKSTTKIKEREKKLINSLKTPIKVPNIEKKTSKYIFDETFRFKPDDYIVFGKNIYDPKPFQLDIIENDRKNLQYLILLHKQTGTRLDSLIWAIHPPDEDLITGFIHAIDSFGQSLTDTKGLEEIKYQDFIILCVESIYIKGYLFLKEKPSARIKELLIIGLERWEKDFEEDIKKFAGQLDPFIDRHLDTFHLFNRLFLSAV